MKTTIAFFMVVVATATATMMVCSRGSARPWRILSHQQASEARGGTCYCPWPKDCPDSSGVADGLCGMFPCEPYELGAWICGTSHTYMKDSDDYPGVSSSFGSGGTTGVPQPTPANCGTAYACNSACIPDPNNPAAMACNAGDDVAVQPTDGESPSAYGEGCDNESIAKLQMHPATRIIASLNGYDLSAKFIGE